MSGPTKMTQAQFVDKCTVMHNSKYNYDCTIYTGSKNNVIIQCPAHGIFEQKAVHHLRGNGCPLCAREYRAKLATRTITDIVDEFKRVHKTRYDYSKVTYLGLQRKVMIGCSIHGDFQQRPSDHIHGMGCPSCGVEQQRMSLSQFLVAANVAHQNKYSYEKVTEFLSSGALIVITCPFHGDFNQHANNHLQQHGCSKCAGTSRGNDLRKTTATFINEANIVHNYRYSYNNTTYISCKKCVVITCSLHGNFTQRPTNHVNMGQGCPKCVIGGRYSEAWFSNNPSMKNINGTLYLLKFTGQGEQFWKVGITKRSISKRWNGKLPYKIDEVFKCSGTLYHIFQIEQHILKTFVYRRRYTPSILIGGDRECFIPKLSDPASCVEDLIGTIRSFLT